MTQSSTGNSRGAAKLGEAQINGKRVSFFRPPHDEPDLPWVDVEELAGAFLDRGARKRMVRHSQEFGKGKRAVATAKNGDRIATIMCHAMAQGLCAMIDKLLHNCPEQDDGPAFKAYCLAAGVMCADHFPLDIPDLIAAWKNIGGPFMRDAV